MSLRRKLLIILGAAVFASVSAAYAAARIIPSQASTTSAEQAGSTSQSHTTLFVVFAIITAGAYTVVYYLLDRLFLSKIRHLQQEITHLEALQPLPTPPLADQDEVEVIAQKIKALAEVMQEADENRSRLGVLLASIPVVMHSLDAEGRLRSIEGLGLADTSLQPQSLIGQPIFEVYPNNPAVVANIQRVLKGEAFSDTMHIDGQVWDVWYAPRQDAAGRIKGAVVVQINVTERDRYETDLQKAKEAAEAANHAKTTFLANMSHELRTPLNAIIGFIGVIQMNKSLDERNLHRVERILANGQRLLELIDDILDLSRLEAGRLAFTPSDINIRHLVGLVQGRLQERADKKSLGFSAQVMPDVPPMIRVDEDAMQKIMMHLLTNAIKFTHQGQVTFTVDYANHHLVIRVQDTGIGIPAHMHDVIFQSFRQVDDSSTREYGGTGLGLAIVHQLCLAMGGTVNLESKVNEGSIFTVKLPVEVQQSGVEI